MKIAKQAGRVARLAGIGLAVVAMWGSRPTMAQQGIDSRFRVPPAAPRDPNAKPADRGKTVDLRNSFNDVPAMQPKRLPVSPNDAIAIVNKQAITRQQLADECVATAGRKVLDTMINRLLIEQALARQNLTVTAAEIDQEIDGIAARFGFSREVWLRALDKERNISPAQYAREIVYPAIALRKLV